MKHLYIHFPFCSSRCGYCDFYSQAGGLDLAPPYVEALLAELAAFGDGAAVLQRGFTDGDFPDLETVYVGGGTPTLAGPGLLAKLLAAVRGCCREGVEVTVEANPSTVTPSLAAGLAAAGVTRVSLGAQSFSERLRRNLGRAGPVVAIAEAVAALRQAGFENIGLDLMFSIPGQTAADLAHDLDQALALAPEHISCYELTVKPGSDYMRRWQRELEAVAEEGHVFYEIVVETLERAGYRWYETSNFALPGKECRHNLAYWDGADFIGAGAGAWSSVGRRRWRNTRDIDTYIEAAARGDWESLRDRENLNQQQRLAELLLLGLRRDRGVDRGVVAGAIDTGQENILLRNGFLINEGGRIWLTRPGRFVANEVCARLLRD
jgi:oxygen-independent coproporphyrinogen-3 oxidase